MPYLSTIDNLYHYLNTPMTGHFSHDASAVALGYFPKGDGAAVRPLLTKQGGVEPSDNQWFRVKSFPTKYFIEPSLLHKETLRPYHI